MPSSTAGWGGGELAISQRHREFHPWARLRSHDTKKVQLETGSPAPLPYQTRNVLYVFRGGTEGVCSSP